MKRIAICCDGTWNRLDAEHPTNVVKMAESITPHACDGTAQVVYYDEGVGTGTTAVAKHLDRLLGGGFGWGLMTKVEQAYRFVILNYEPGDELYVFGFSRGAYTARSLVGLIRNCGIVRKCEANRIGEAITLYRGRNPDTQPDADRSLRFRASLSPHVYLSDKELAWRKNNVPGFDENTTMQLKVRYLGVWDTVGALGVPAHLWFSSLFNRKYQFHDPKLSSNVASARHAVAIDEMRQTFPPALWNNLDLLNQATGGPVSGPGAAYQQLWFPGEHGSVGGGGDVVGLSNAGLAWIAEGAAQVGLEFTSGTLDNYRRAIDYRAPLRNSTKPTGITKYLSRKPRTGPQSIDDLSEWAVRRWKERPDALAEKRPYRPATLMQLSQELDAANSNLRIHAPAPPTRRTAA